eukprot:CAMPEP_0206042574 /NCGR_PEP_ID=MMETSP1466-20131121/6635_1 /ASSEMBLY_ACC=CAM_ASM_001126 /TAXON_ID=44452 /ORGANISM="Pavlova gyrans, Strain CCMP608" /LENGTH=408 /DNA_ID=CAMNT_0053417287 /DNA_START=54 /DNA_END=1280 /DNA_ORIENTATION=+
MEAMTLSFEPRGISGYTGYVPNGQIIQPGIKDTTLHTGRVRSGSSVRGTGGLVVEKSGSTEYAEAYTMTPDMFPKDMAARASGTISPYNPFHDGRMIQSKPLVGQSSYVEEILAGADKTAHVGNCGLFVGGQIRPEATGKKNILYETVTQEKQAEALEVAAVIRPHVKIGGYEDPPPDPTAKERERLERDFKSIERAAARNTFDTSYRRSFGGKGFEPRSAIPLTVSDLSLKASTREHFSGTPKAVAHVPGYCGFIASAPGNRVAVAHSHKVMKPSTKDIHLSELRQFPRNIPGYLGYQPRAFANQADRNRDMTMTTAGRADIAGSGAFKPGDLGSSMNTKATVQYTPSTVGVSNSLVSDFFTHAALTVSDNGVHNAEAYFKLLRPYEGRSTAIIKQVDQAPILSNLV